LAMSCSHALVGLATRVCSARKRVDEPSTSVTTSTIGRTCSPCWSQRSTVRSETPKETTSVDVEITLAAAARPGLPCTPTTPSASGCDSSIAPLASSLVTTGDAVISASLRIASPSWRAARPTAKTTRSLPEASSSAMPAMSSGSPICASTRRFISAGLAEQRCSGAESSAPWMSTGTPT